MDPTCHCFLDHSLLEPPLSGVFRELNLSTVSLLANASSTPSGQHSRGSLERELDSPMPPLTYSKLGFYPIRLFQGSDEEIPMLALKPGCASRSLEDVSHQQYKTELRRNSAGLDLLTAKRLRHNSASPRFPIYSVKSEPLKFNKKAPETTNPLSHPKPCYVMRVNVTDNSTSTNTE
ncbi:unnamed protein product [Mesocestoides corti]|uniref:Macrophage immunometabolism regulator n=1 Tax=Mesocestoides corti TaxID=53468 RepID=A0A0R3U246_MESCO|nr:unnamed protein product [Mesocestoides corti]